MLAFEHTKIDYWDVQRGKFQDQRALVLQSMLVAEADYWEVTQLQLTKNSTDSGKLAYDRSLAMYSIDALSMMYNIAMLASLDTKHFSKDQIHNDTTYYSRA